MYPFLISADEANSLTCATAAVELLSRRADEQEAAAGGDERGRRGPRHLEAGIVVDVLIKRLEIERRQVNRVGSVRRVSPPPLLFALALLLRLRLQRRHELLLHLARDGDAAEVRIGGRRAAGMLKLRLAPRQGRVEDLNCVAGHHCSGPLSFSSC
eukprot:scaffold8958_cov110-Isochrysis_galbana.AAC.4